MMPKSVIGLACVLACGIASWAAEDFRRSYDLSQVRELYITNFLGEVKVTGHSGDAIEVLAHIEGGNRGSVEIIDRSHGPRIEVFSKCSLWPMTPDTKVFFEVKVPDKANGVSIALETGNGSIDTTGYNGNLWAKSGIGNISVANVTGSIIVKSLGGNVDAKLNQVKDQRWLEFSSRSGNVKVVAPSDFEAKIHMTSSRGRINTDFPVPIHEGRYGEKTADGILGSTTQKMNINSLWGSVSLLKQ
jgi:hypothetical protein